MQDAARDRARKPTNSIAPPAATRIASAAPASVAALLGPQWTFDGRNGVEGPNHARLSENGRAGGLALARRLRHGLALRPGRGGR